MTGKVCLNTCLNCLFLQCQCVNDSDFSGLLCEKPNAVGLVLPPGLAKVVGPVRAWAGRGCVDKPALRAVVPNTACHRTNIGFHL